MRSLLPRILLTLALASGWPIAATAETFEFHHEEVLGTSLTLRIDAASANAAERAEAKLLAEIDRLSGIFSTYSVNGEFSRWQRDSLAPVKVSPELLAMLRAADQWRNRSEGAFEPAIEPLTRLWRQAEERGSRPTPGEIALVLASIQQPHWTLDQAAGTATRTSDCPLTLNAIAKGAIVEWACDAVVAVGNVSGLSVNLGGDLRMHGELVEAVAIADPFRDAENAPPAARIYVANSAVATSGGYRRGFQIGNRWYSHILDPRTGEPVEQVASATVVAPSSSDADALATICNVLPIHASLALVGSLSGTECLLISADGTHHASRGWSRLTTPQAAQKKLAMPPDALAKADAPEASELLELVVNFELNRPGDGRYRRPYVAVWLEDEDQFPVKTAVLWMQTKAPGPRWHRDLLRWYRNDGVRRLAGGADLIGTISAATRGPGEYRALFDGTDDAGNPLKSGKYTLYIEAAREHGTYQLIKQPLELGKAPISKTELKGNAEIKSARFEYRPAQATASQPAE